MGPSPASCRRNPVRAAATAPRRLWALSQDATVAATATNGANDRLGDVELGEVRLDVIVPIEVLAFRATPHRAPPGSPVVLSWQVGGAHAVRFTVEAPGAATGLATCVGLGPDGAGYCTVTLDLDLPLGSLTFTLEAPQDGGRSLDARTSVDVIAGPAVASFTATPSILVPGQTATVAWTVFGSDTVALGALPPGRRGAACHLTVHVR